MNKSRRGEGGESNERRGRYRERLRRRFASINMLGTLFQGMQNTPLGRRGATKPV